MVKQSRLTFFTDLIEQVMKNVDDQVLENDILPVIYPILKWRRIENKDLYESAHTAVISAFIAEKPVSRELAGVYSKILIEVKQKTKIKSIHSNVITVELSSTNELGSIPLWFQYVDPSTLWHGRCSSLAHSQPTHRKDQFTH
jgi:hypothetical protein